MRRILTSTLILGVVSAFGLAGCGDETKVKEKETISTPTGSTTTTYEKKVQSSGSNPPTSSSGETATTPR
jgi:hypothetical protein